jgi:hypothetical protein
LGLRFVEGLIALYDGLVDELEGDFDSSGG